MSEIFTWIGIAFVVYLFVPCESSINLDDD